MYGTAPPYRNGAHAGKQRPFPAPHVSRPCDVAEKRNEPPGDTNQNFNDMLTLRIANHSCQLGGKKLIALLAFLLSAPQAMFAYDFSQDGLAYDILSEEDKTCEVAGCTSNLSTVVIPSTVVNNGTTYTVTSIGNSAFYWCSGLTSVEIPSSVTSIGDEAFYGCSGLTAIQIPSSVTSIGEWAFYRCSGLAAVEIPSSVTSIGNYAFSGCSGLTAIEIPSSVTSIGERAFYWCSGLTSVEIPNSVTSIGNSAFYWCSGLTSVEIPSSVTSIGDEAFYGCSGLNQLILEDGEEVLVISYNTFNDCPITTLYLGRNVNDYVNFKSLETLTIGSSITSIGNSAFKDCNSLTAVEIPNSVTSIGERAFYGCSGLTSVEIPNSVTSIGSSAFSGCSSLTSVEIPSSVTSIGSSTFSGCSSLTAVEIPSSVTSIGSSAFSGCSSLTAVEIPSSVTSIGDYAFSDCVSLTAVEIPSSVTSIGKSAFYGCERLHSVTIGAGVLSIGSYAFGYQDGIYTYRPRKVIWLCNTPPEGYDNAEGTVNYVANTSYEDLENVKVYPYLSSLFEVGGIKYVPVSPSERTCEAIDCAYDITSSVVHIGRTVNYQGVEMTVEDIRPYVCYDNDHMKALHLNGYVGDIGDYAFYDCDNLAGIIIPNTVDSLGASCFEGCTALTQATINVNGSFGASCFEGCTALTQAILGDSITEIPGSCFRDCSALPEITIPAAVERIGNNVFEGCTSLANVTIADRDSVLTLGNNYYNEPMFADCPLNAVYIGGNISYSTDASDGYSPFYRNTSLESVTITDKETEISENEFYGCTNLKNVTLGDGIETIGSYAFSGCAALTDFTFGSSLKSIGEEAFSDCTAMTRLVSRTAEPPVCGPQALDDINKWTCKLYVPDASIDAYQSADQWKEFFFITDIAHAVEDGGSPADRILSGRVQVFDLSGRQLKEARNANSIDEVLNGLPSGTYILRGSGAAMKVAHE